MAVVRPFRAMRPRKEKVDKVVALPYDVMNREEAAEMAEGNPYSFLHISRAEIDLPAGADPYCDAVYEKSRENIAKCLKTGFFMEEKEPTLYIYRQTMEGRIQTGIVGCVSIDDYEKGVIKKHELTRIGKEMDRVKHFDACNANTEPVFITYRENAKITELIDRYARTHHPEYDIVTPDGIGHALWVIKDNGLVAELSYTFDKDVPEMYIADGHHRSASGYNVGKQRRKENPGYTGDEEFNYFMAVVFPDSDLKIYDYNRVLKDLGGNTPEQFIEKIEKAGFDVEDMGTDIYRPAVCHEFSMYMEEHWYRLTAKKSIIPEDVVGSLDVSILQERLLNPILGIKDPRANTRIGFVGGIRGLEELKRRADTDMKLAFAMYPMSMEQLMEIADAGEIMPPKSTWFEPKIGSGLFVHRL